MINLTILIGTRKGFRKVSLRGFSSQKALQVNANDGRNIDRSADIADEFRGDRAGLDTYFRDKESSIQRDFIQDTDYGFFFISLQKSNGIFSWIYFKGLNIKFKLWYKRQK